MIPNRRELIAGGLATMAGAPLAAASQPAPSARGCDPHVPSPRHTPALHASAAWAQGGPP